MSTTVTYKGNTLTTVNNETKSLLTAGTWLEDNIEITDTTSGGGAISVVDTLDVNGGTIRTITAVNISDTTATAADVAQGKYFYTANGTKTAGTASGGVDYASGTYTPASAIRSFTVSVDFEPEFALVVADPTDFAQDSNWKESMFLNDFTINWNFHAMTRWLNNAYNSTGGAGTENMGTYSDGVFTFNRPSNLNFVAGITYRWHLWRETT